MFTPAGGQSRNTRTTRSRTSGSQAGDDTAPISGPPSYSYGSPETRRATRNKASVMDVNELDTPIKLRDVSEEPSERDTQLNLVTSKRGPTLDDIEASINRRRSLRSASRSLGRGSPSILSRASRRSNEEISLEYEVTQSSGDRLEVPNEDLLVEVTPVKETHFADETTYDDMTTQYIEVPKDLSHLEHVKEKVKFLSFFIRRISQLALAKLRQLPGLLQRHVRLWHLLPLLLALLVPVLLTRGLPSVRIPSINRSKHYNPPVRIPSDDKEFLHRFTELEKVLKAQVDHLDHVQSLIASASTRANALETNLGSVKKSDDHLATNLKELAQSLSTVQVSLQKSREGDDETRSTIDRALKRLKKLESDMISNSKTLQEQMKRASSLEESMKGLDKSHQSLIKRLEILSSSDPSGAGSKEELLHAVQSILPDAFVASLDAGNTNQLSERILELLKHTMATKSDTAWHAFIDANDARLKEYLSRQQEAHDAEASRTGQILSREAVMDLLDQKISNASQSQSGFPQHNIEELIDGALHRFSQDTLARPDFAAYTAGGRINPYLTSMTYMHRPSSFIGRAVSKVFFNIGSTWSRPPAVAIHPDNTIGMCWAFPGHNGQLCVKLARPILLSDIVIEHIHPDIAHDASSAPQAIEIWAQPADPGVEIPQVTDEDIREPPAPGFMHVMDVNYNVYNERKAIQVFSVPQQFKALDIPIAQIIYRVQSNWGNEIFTCIYRVRAIGAIKSTQSALGSDEDESI